MLYFQLPVEQLSASEAPFADLVRENSNFPVTIIVVISLIAVINGMLIQIIMGSRVLFGMSKSNMAPGLFSYIGKKNQIPLAATTFVTILIIFFALALPLISLAKITSTIILFVFASVNISLVAIKIKEKDKLAKSYLNLPLVIPMIGFLLCISLLIFHLAQTFW